MEIKEKINKRELIKLKSSCTMKETICKVERQLSEWEKIIANKARDKELISKNIQATPAAQFQKNKQPNQKMGQRTKQTFLQRSLQRANKHRKRCSTSLIIREMQIKTTMRYISCRSEWLLFKSLQTINAGEGVEKRDPSYTVDGNAN